jgi:hypothetical protein
MSDAYALFLDRAKRLESSPFWAWMTSSRGEPDWKRVLAGDWLAHDQLKAEELDSFCLNLRLLIQDRDGFSLRCIRDLASTWPQQYQERARLISEATTDLNQLLSQKSLVSLNPGEKTTHRELFDIIFYGGIAHADPTKRDEFARIERSGLFSAFAFEAFCAVLLHYRNCIIAVAYQVALYVEDQESTGASAV